MKQINNYILEKLHLSKDTKIKDPLNIIISIGGLGHQREAIKVLQKIIEELKITNIDDFFISSWQSLDDLKHWFNYIDNYFIDNEEKLADKLIRNNDIHAKEVYVNKEKILHIIKYTLNKKIIAFCISFHTENNKHHTLYFVDDRDK